MSKLRLYKKCYDMGNLRKKCEISGFFLDRMEKIHFILIIGALKY